MNIRLSVTFWKLESWLNFIQHKILLKIWKTSCLSGDYQLVGVVTENGANIVAGIDDLSGETIVFLALFKRSNLEYNKQYHCNPWKKL